jgi:hypothetical protein
MLEMLKQDPQMLQAFTPFLTDEQVKLVMREASRDDQA